ncbi:MAG: hypothetical protein QW564_02745 [Sulfolobales archaeon]
MANASEPIGQANLKETLASVAEIYSALYSTKRVGFYRVLKEIVRKGVRKRTSALQKLRTIAKLHEEDIIRLRLDYYLHMMKLNIAAIYLTKSVDCLKLPQATPFLRSCANTIPTGTFLTFFYPEHLRPRKLEEVGVKHYTFYERIFSRVDIDRYVIEIVDSPTSLFSPRKIEEHFARELRKTKDEEFLDLDIEIHGQEIKPKVDNKDLAIIRSIELEPLTTASLDVKLGVKKDILEKHVEHVETVLRGIRVRKIKSIADFSRTSLIVMVSGGGKQILRLINTALKYPITVATSVSKDVKLLLLQLLLPGSIDIIRDSTLEIRKLILDQGLELIDYYLIDLETLVNFTVPYIKELEYSPIARDWLEKSVRKSLKYLKED